ncbi:MAG: DUF4131 domain-containing protein [Bacteroidetes bacterium]|jgi:competence protein ComEC|nr:DUF4131 domain-containing protein [Bacteroidota bacterium]
MNDLVISLKRSPLLIALIPFMIGISFASANLVSSFTWFFLGVVTGVIVLITCRKLNFSVNYLWGILLAMVLITVGYLHYGLYHDYHNAQVKTASPYKVKAVCMTTPEQTSYGHKCEMLVTHKGEKRPVKIKPFSVIVYLQQEDNIDFLKTGSSILAVMRFSEIRNRGNPHEFDYKHFQYLNNIYYSGRIIQQQWVLLPGNKLPVRRFAEKCRDYFQANIDFTIFSDREKAILTAMCLGDKSYMTERTMMLFQRMGIAHLFAVSGLHVGFVFLLFQGIFGRVAKYSRATKILSVLIPVIGIWLFTFITGLPESAIRASIMFSVIALGRLSDKKHYSVNNLALAAFIILIINPKQLFQIGFQLSFLAVLGILLLYNKINRAVYFRHFAGRKIWELISISLSAQLFIFPLLLYHFHQFSFAFVISNIMATPVAALLLYGGVLLNVFTFIPILQSIIAYLVKFVFTLFLLALDALENVTWFFADNIYITQYEFIILLLLTFSVVLLIYFFHARNIFLVLSMALAFTICNLNKRYQQKRHKSVTVFNIPGSTTISFVSDQKNVLLTDTAIFKHPDKEEYYLAGQYMATGTRKNIYPLNINASGHYQSPNLAINALQNNYWIRFEDLTVLVLDSPVLLSDKYHVDVLIIRNFKQNSIQSFLTNIQAGIIVFDNTSAYYHVDRWKYECDENNQPYHHVQKSGAYEFHL